MPAPLQLTPEQEAEAQRITERLILASRADFEAIARILASKADCHLFGATEFEIRDQVHRIGARALETALEERKKGGTKVPA